MKQMIRTVGLRVACGCLCALLLCGCGGGTDVVSGAGVSSKTASKASKSASSDSLSSVLDSSVEGASSVDASSTKNASASLSSTKASSVKASSTKVSSTKVSSTKASSVKSSSTATSSATNNSDAQVEAVTNGTLVTYPEYDARIERDYAYDVSVTQGKTTKSLTCYNHCDSVATSGRTVNGDTVRRFCEFAFGNGPVRVDITVKADFNSYTVMPSAKNFESVCRGNVISVYLEKPEYFLIKLDDKDDSILSVFADEPETDVPSKTASNTLYIDGWYEPAGTKKVLTITQDNYTVYLAPGSVLNARVKVKAKNVTIKGRGMILDPVSDIYHADASYYGDKTNDARFLLTVSGSGCKINDIKLVDARDFNLYVNASNTKVNGMKVLASEMCTDGITTAWGDNQSFTHCFIYNADNALVIAHGNGQVFKDITIGTICCAVFPQLDVGQATLTDIYVFRADEGLMRNLYNSTNPGTTERSFSMTLTNVNCMDCDHFPFIFMGGNMGNKAKTITFNNLAVPVATGSNTLGQGNGATIQFSTASNYLATTNYKLVFNGLSVGGKAVTSASALKTSGNATQQTITVTGNGASTANTAATKKISCVAPGKIFIGNRQLFLKNNAVEQSGTWYVPADDVCKALACSVPASTKTISGVKYVPITAFSGAKYTASTKTISIPALSKSDNLLNWFHTAYHSHWAEYTCYYTHLVYKDGVFRNVGSSASTGAIYQLTQQIKQYGAGKYTFTAEMKADTSCNAEILIAIRGNTSVVKTIPLTSSWKTVTFTFNNTATDPANAYLRLVAKIVNSGVAFRNASLVYEK